MWQGEEQPLMATAVMATRRSESKLLIILSLCKTVLYAVWMVVLLHGLADSRAYAADLSKDALLSRPLVLLLVVTIFGWVVSACVGARPSGWPWVNNKQASLLTLVLLPVSDVVWCVSMCVCLYV